MYSQGNCVTVLLEAVIFGCGSERVGNDTDLGTAILQSQETRVGRECGWPAEEAAPEVSLLARDTK